MTARRPLPRRLDATQDDLSRARDAAHAIAAATLGHEPGPMATAASMSHYVYIGADVVVKLVDVDGHQRLELEIALASHLPPALGAHCWPAGATRRTRTTSGTPASRACREPLRASACPAPTPRRWAAGPSKPSNGSMLCTPGPLAAPPRRR